MNPVNRFLVLVTFKHPVSNKHQVHDGKQEIQSGQLSLTCRQVILDPIILQIIHLSTNSHGDKTLRITIGEEKAIFIGNANGVRLIKGRSRWRREITEGEEVGSVL